MKKKIIIIATIILVVIIVGIVTFIINKNKPSEDLTDQKKGTEILTPVDMNNLENAKIEDNEKVNVSEEILKDRVIKELKLTNISLKTDNGASLITADVKNTSKEDFEGGTLVFKFINNDGVQFAILDARVQPIKSGKKGEIAAKTTADLIYAKDLNVELNN